MISAKEMTRLAKTVQKRAEDKERKDQAKKAADYARMIKQHAKAGFPGILEKIKKAATEGRNSLIASCTFEVYRIWKPKLEKHGYTVKYDDGIQVIETYGYGGAGRETRDSGESIRITWGTE